MTVKDKERKELIRSFFETLRTGTVFDPDFAEDQIESTREFADQEIIDHITGKKIHQ